MKQHILILTLSLFLFSCAQKNDKQRELDLKEKELALKQKELELKEKEGPANTTNNTISAGNATTEEMVLDIRNEIKRQGLVPLTTKKFNFICDTDGTITYFLENDKIVKVAIDWGFIGDYSSTSDYYYRNDKLIFVFEVSIGGPAGLPEEKTEERTYIKDDVAFKYMRNQKVEPCPNCRFNESSREYGVLRALASKNFKAALCN